MVKMSTNQLLEEVVIKPKNIVRLPSYSFPNNIKSLLNFSKFGQNFHMDQNMNKMLLIKNRDIR